MEFESQRAGERRTEFEGFHGSTGCPSCVSKRILLFEEILREYCYPDMGVVAELREGANLVGDVAASMLPFKFTPSIVSVDAMRMQSSMRRDSILAEASGSGDDKIDNGVWDKTMEECNLGWLQGPIPLKEVPSDAPISRRFGLKQKHKVRMIDDFTESSVNQAVTVFESPRLHTIDVACALVFFSAMKMSGQQCSLKARTFDLSSAYRQVAVSPEGRKYQVRAVKKSCHAALRGTVPKMAGCAFFRWWSFMFGAIKSVHFFLRLARAIWWLGTVACSLMWSSFVDDYTVFSTLELVRSNELTATALFRLLGWAFEGTHAVC